MPLWSPGELLAVFSIEYWAGWSNCQGVLCVPGVQPQSTWSALVLTNESWPFVFTYEIALYWIRSLVPKSSCNYVLEPFLWHGKACRLPALSRGHSNLQVQYMKKTFLFMFLSPSCMCHYHCSWPFPLKGEENVSGTLLGLQPQIGKLWFTLICREVPGLQMGIFSSLTWRFQGMELRTSKVKHGSVILGYRPSLAVMGHTLFSSQKTECLFGYIPIAITKIIKQNWY